MATLKQIRERLTKAFEPGGSAQTEPAEKLKVSLPIISRYLRGDKMPAPDTPANLCRILGISPAYIPCFE